MIDSLNDGGNCGFGTYPCHYLSDKERICKQDARKPNGNSTFTIICKDFAVNIQCLCLSHELRHNFGCAHNIEKRHSNGPFIYGHGHLVEAGNGNPEAKKINQASPSNGSPRP